MADARCDNHRNMTISVALLAVTLCIVFLAYYAFSENHIDSSESTVIFATVVFRHGERSPTGLYPNDPHHDDFKWIGGFGALTLRGALQGFKLGEKVRKRYTHLLPSNGFYTTNEMYVSSSSTERCLMTAQSFLAALLPPPNNGQNLLPIKWQPVAINSVPRDRDKLISQKANCPKYDDLLAKMYSDPPEELRKFLQDNTELFEYISKHTGANISNVHQGEQLYNILSIEKKNGLKLPKWTESVFPDKLLALAERNLAVLTETDYMKQIKGGFFVTDVLDKMVRKKNNQLEPDRKLFIYSGHDVTLVNVMRALDIIPQTTRKPDFAAALYFELHQNPLIVGDLEVKIFYSFNHESELKRIDIPNCDSPCSLETFSNVLQPIIVHDYEEMCKL
ncbi:lysosomal acid phosphatase [Sitodiplosis mosellana]|uniref:lysosomal acid phosphatase n=1 Tax=Sitodiplosis mosellana TaxID=263140 RepID=UPI002444C6F2|nr:lysosomal acid phosphatase [Sitodiplosis mosellana]